ncbi:MAG TPA: hypothetical protein DCM14_02080, partial [Clostridiales bacterium UBA8153]|nr:hypothetical protein [Clostridiales bacterium UBA8153]
MPNVTIFDEIKQTTNCLDLAQELGLNPTRVGMIRCPDPAHGDRNPSCKVYLDAFYCYGCGKRWSSIDLVMQVKSWDLLMAARYLADRAGLAWPEPSEAARQEYERQAGRQAALQQQVTVWAKSLRPVDLEYLRGRGFTEDFVREHSFGYGGHGTPQAVEAARGLGLLVATQDGRDWYMPGERLAVPFFRYDRVVQVAFHKPGGVPKYLYPTGWEKPLVTNAARYDRTAFLAEGVFDYFSLLQAELPAATCLGTQASATQRLELDKFKDLVVLFDGDDAGRAGAWKLAAEFLPAARVAGLPDGQDLNDLLRERGADAFKTFCLEAAREAKNFLDLQLDQLAINPGDAEARQQAIIGIARLDPVKQDIYTEALYGRIKSIGVKKPTLEKEVKAAARAGEDERNERNRAKEPENRSLLSRSVYAPWLEALSQTRYRVNGRGSLCYVKYSEKGGEEEIPLANFLARPVREVTRDNGAEREIEFELAGILAGGHELPTARVAAKDFSTLSWVPSAWGLGANVEPGQGCKDRVRHAIQCLAQNVAKETVYAHLGWRKLDGAWVYLHAGGAIGANGPVAGVAVDPGEKLQEYALPEPRQDAGLLAAVRASLALLRVAPAGITYPLVAAVYRAPLGEALPVDLSMFLAGPTGAKKTSLLALMQAHWGAGFHDRRLPGGWDSTANALEKLAFLAKDAVLVVDDFAPKGAPSDVQRLHREADRLLRAQGNLIGRSRMRADGSLRPDYAPRGLMACSGEDIPRGQSLRARGLILEVGPDDVDLARLTELQGMARSGLLAAAMAGYVRWLAGRMDDLKRELRERHEHLRAEARKASFSHDRTPDIVASLGLGWQELLAFATESGAVTQEEATKLWCEGWEALRAAGEAQSGHLAGEEPTGRFLALLAAAITSGKAHLADAKTGGEPAGAAAWGWRERDVGLSTEWQPLGDRVGWLDGDELLLDPEAAYATAQKFARDQNASLSVTQRVLWKRLAEKRMLVSAAPGKHVAYTTIPALGKRMYVLHLYAGSLLSTISGTIGTPGTVPPGTRAFAPEKVCLESGHPQFQAQKIGTAPPP